MRFVVDQSVNDRMVGLREWKRGRFWDRICRRAGEEALAVMSLLRVRS